MPKSGSDRPLSAVTGPLTCTSLPSLPASTLSAPIETTAPAPSASERAVCTARPSFQNSPITISTIKSRPKITPPTARLIRPNHETEVTSRNESLIVSPETKDAGSPHGTAANDRGRNAATNSIAEGAHPFGACESIASDGARIWPACAVPAFSHARRPRKSTSESHVSPSDSILSNRV